MEATKTKAPTEPKAPTKTNGEKDTTYKDVHNAEKITRKGGEDRGARRKELTDPRDHLGHATPHASDHNSAPTSNDEWCGSRVSSLGKDGCQLEACPCAACTRNVCVQGCLERSNAASVSSLHTFDETWYAVMALIPDSPERGNCQWENASHAPVVRAVFGVLSAIERNSKAIR